MKNITKIIKKLIADVKIKEKNPGSKGKSQFFCTKQQKSTVIYNFCKRLVTEKAPTLTSELKSCMFWLL